MLNLKNVRLGQRVRASQDIQDNPLSKQDDGAKSDEIGSIQDIDTCAELVVVEFSNERILLCAPRELRLA